VPGSFKTEAVVLRSIRFGEADRVLHLYTDDRGRVGAMAKGVRRVRSRLGGRLEPLNRVRLVLHEGRGELCTVSQADTVCAHAALRDRRASLERASQACEAVLRLLDSNEPNRPAYNLLCNELSLLDAHPELATQAQALAFRLKLLLAAGFVPELTECTQCGVPTATNDDVPPPSRFFFSAAAGGVICGDCTASDGFALDASALSFMLKALAVPLKQAPRAHATTLAQVDRVVTGTLEYHAHVRLRSAA
jgi:DNA repair protein RecO (recombination protein O)